MKAVIKKGNLDMARADRLGIKDHSSSRTKRAMLFVREYGLLEVLKRSRQYHHQYRRDCDLEAVQSR